MDQVAFDQYVASGGNVDITDWMPEEYRNQALRIVSFQALAEIIGTMMYAEWLPKIPNYERKMMITAKVQDEIGHGHILLRVCEDLGKARESIMEDYLNGKAKLLNIFHYSIDDYCEMGIAALLQNSAAITQMMSLSKGSFLPYVRALKKIMKEESFHYHQAIDMMAYVLENGDDSQKQTVQSGLDKWFPIVLAYFGPSDKDSVHNQKTMKWRLKVHSNDELRQQWLDHVVPILEGFGLKINDPLLKKDPETKLWTYTEPDWVEVKKVLDGSGPKSEHWRLLFKRNFEQNAWVRDIVLMNRMSA